MDKIILFFCFIINSIVTIELALTLFGCKKSLKKVLLVSFLSGGLDYLVMKIIVPSFSLSNGIHIITGLIFSALACRYILNLNKVGSISVTLLSYILSGLGELIIFIFLVVFIGVNKINNETVVSMYALTGLLMLMIPLVYLKLKNITLIKIPIEENI